ncbi:unnamed protein product, partial [Discosporangium mesarthrocarpum]
QSAPATLLRYPATIATSSGHVDVTRELMAAGVDVNTVDKMKRTALWLAVDENRVKVVEELCQAGADINLAGPDGRSPLHIAARKGLNDCAAILLNHGAETDNNPDR